MEKAGILAVFGIAIIFLIPLMSAEIIINQQPKEIYNLGEVVSVPVTIKTSSDVSGIFQMDFLCSGKQENFYKNGINLEAGQEKRLEPELVLIKGVIGESKGTCKIKAYLGKEFALTNEFRISNLININSEFGEQEFSPGENLLIEGEAIKENGQAASGIIELSVVEGNKTIVNKFETINNGYFVINTTLPAELKAGAYLLTLNAYETDSSGEKTNRGFMNKNVNIKQVPTSLEIFLENPDVEPGTGLRFRAILRDQTGEKIISSANVTIKDNKDKIIEKFEGIGTDELFEFPIAYNQAPAEWKVSASSNEIGQEAKFRIAEKESIKIDIANKTLIITNTGNIPYNKTALIKVGEDSLYLDVYLEVDKSQKYILSAPDGSYQVEIVSGDDSFSQEVALTGKAVDVKKAGAISVGGIVKYPFVWIFIILITGFVAFFVFRKGYQRAFIGHISKEKTKTNKPREFVPAAQFMNLVPLSKGSLIKSRNKAEVSLSIKGDKQDVSVVSIHVKNLGEIRENRGGAEEALQKISDMAESYRTVVNESGNNFLFIFVPSKTRTFKNEGNALKLAQKASEILTHHNKMFKQKINFGISLNYGTIVGKQERDSFKFTSLGTLMTNAKKISSLSEGEILLDDKMNEKLRSSVKTEKKNRQGVDVYPIKEIKTHASEENQKFIRSFVEKQKKDAREREDRERK